MLHARLLMCSCSVDVCKCNFCSFGSAREKKLHSLRILCFVLFPDVLFFSVFDLSRFCWNVDDECDFGSLFWATLNRLSRTLKSPSTHCPSKLLPTRHLYRFVCFTAIFTSFMFNQSTEKSTQKNSMLFEPAKRSEKFQFHESAVNTNLLSCNRKSRGSIASREHKLFLKRWSDQR